MVDRRSCGFTVFQRALRTGGQPGGLDVFL